jgi:hypothetical protein
MTETGKLDGGETAAFSAVLPGIIAQFAMPGHRSAIDIATKKEAIAWIATHGGGVPSRAERHFRKKGWDISAATFRSWWKKRHELEDAPGHRKRLPGAGRKPLLASVEETLFDLIIERRIRKEKVTRDWIAETALALFEHSGGEAGTFLASENWVTRFMDRFDLTIRRRTNLTTLDDEVLVGRAVAYMEFLELHKPNMDPARVVLMDETALYFEDLRDTTVEQEGARHIVIRSTGFASMRVTLILAVTMSGRKLMPIIVEKGKATFEFVRVGGCLVIRQPKAWVDQDLLLRWLEWTFPSVYDAPGQYLVWDSMRAHIGKRVKAESAKKDVKMCVIPGGLTPYLQAGDVGIYKSFKDKVSEHITEWKHSDAVSYTRGGNPRPPPTETVADWVTRAWNAVSKEVVLRSVYACGFDDDHSEWFIAKHDVYGRLFRQMWARRDGSGAEAQATEEVHEDAISLALDELVIDA